MPWPPTVEEVFGEISENVLTSFVGWLRNAEQKQPSSTPQVIAIASLFQALITKKRKVLWTSLIYGLSRSSKLVDNSRTCGIGISCHDVKNLFETWAKFDATIGSAPPEIAIDLPAVVVMDNDDFKTDLLTGTSDSNHRTNVMFVQSEDPIKQIIPAIKPKLMSSNDMLDLSMLHRIK